MRYLSYIILVFICGAAQAQETCNVSEFKDNINYQGKLETTLAYTDQVASEIDSSGESGSDVSFLDLGTLSYKDADKITESLKRIMNITWNHSEEHSLIISQISEEGRRALERCYENQGLAPIVVFFGTNAAYSRTFNLHALWKQNSPNPAPIRYFPVNANIIGDPQTSVATGETAIVQFQRVDPFEPVNISLTIGGRDEEVLLPAMPKYLLRKEVRTARTKVKEVYGGSDTLTDLLCLRLDNNEQNSFIIPTTVRFSSVKSIVVMGNIGISRRTITDREVCATITWSLSSQQGRIKGYAEVSADVYVATPIDLSTRSPIANASSFSEFATFVPGLAEAISTAPGTASQ